MRGDITWDDCKSLLNTMETFFSPWEPNKCATRSNDGPVAAGKEPANSRRWRDFLVFFVDKTRPHKNPIKLPIQEAFCWLEYLQQCAASSFLSCIFGLGFKIRGFAGADFLHSFGKPEPSGILCQACGKAFVGPATSAAPPAGNG